MPLKLEFLGLDRPALHSAADYLLAHFPAPGSADLRQVIAVVPGGRAGRRLLEILVQLCESRGLVLAPPFITTVGRLPELLYRPKRPFASELVQRLVWAETLQSLPSDRLRPVIPQPPSPDDRLRWMELGDLIRRQHQELAADGLDFGHVARLDEQIEGFAEAARWRALSEIQTEYLRRLDGLELWDLQTARLVAVERRECATDKEIVLIGTADMNVTLRRMLDQVKDQVTALVFSAPDWQDRFDDDGCLIPARWSSVPLPLKADQLVLSDGPADQAAAVRDLIASFDGKYCADEIVVGMPSEDLIPDVQRTLAGSHRKARWGPGTKLADSPPLQLIRLAARFVERSRYKDYAALLRHRDIQRWLQDAGVGGSAVQELDRYYQDHLPFYLDGEWRASRSGLQALRAAWAKTEQLLRRLRRPPQPLANWGEPIFQLLVDVYGDLELDRRSAADQMVWEACHAIREALLRHSQVPAQVMPTVSASAAIRWLLEDLQQEMVPAPAEPDAIELLGWLELPLDDAPALIVTSFNEGLVPASVNSDVFLPNSLREKLGITDNERRYARDAYAVSILASTRESVHFIIGRRTREGDPLAPSRLLFATDPATAAQRAKAFFAPPNPGPPATLPAVRSEADGLSVPRPKPLAAPLTQLNVTAFRDYLACPYRFYLRHVLRLEPIDDTPQEMDGRAFGNLAHDVLREFGRSSQRDSTDPDEIDAFLRHELNQCLQRQYGRYALPAVLVQAEQLRIRLRAFAQVQAAHAAHGWRIEHTEVAPPETSPAELLVDDLPFQLRGRIDRIDVHAETGARVIWDYKTSDSAKKPAEVHQRQGSWIDLQLPLYRHLAAAAGISGPVRLGYILLPKDTSRTEMVYAEWNDEELEEADRTACDVIRRLRREEFWPPVAKPPDYSEVYAAICQDEVQK